MQLSQAAGMRFGGARARPVVSGCGRLLFKPVEDDERDQIVIEIAQTLQQVAEELQGIRESVELIAAAMPEK